ncbi:MAG: DUF5681 domain-containing protein [Methylocella sp.]|nr:MAG: hypothetical protein DLM68_09435 [Hyphomicrobiales bacterium]
MSGEDPDLPPARADAHESAEEHSKAYEVGYGRPPREHRFRPGRSGNPRGRPKGARNLDSVVAATLGERIAVTENGRRKRITKLEAAVKQFVNRAASGEARSMQLLLALVQASESRPPQADPNEPTEADVIVLDELRRRFEKSAQ